MFYLDSEARESPLWPSLATADAEKVTKDSILPTYPVRVYEHSILYRTGGAWSRNPSPPCPPVFYSVSTGAEMVDLGCFWHAFLESDAGKLEKSLRAVISEVPICNRIPTVPFSAKRR